MNNMLFLQTIFFAFAMIATLLTIRRAFYSNQVLKAKLKYFLQKVLISDLSQYKFRIIPHNTLSSLHINCSSQCLANREDEGLWL